MFKGKYLLASSSDDNTVRIWNTTSFELVHILSSTSNNIYGLKLVSSEILASGSQDNTIKLWNITSGNLVDTLKGHGGDVYFCVDYLKNEAMLVSGSTDRTIKLWDMDTGVCSQTIQTGLSIYALTVFDLNIGM